MGPAFDAFSGIIGLLGFICLICLVLMGIIGARSRDRTMETNAIFADLDAEIRRLRARNERLELELMRLRMAAGNTGEKPRSARPSATSSLKQKEMNGLCALGLEPRKIHDKRAIRKAYRARVMQVHPDKGGTPESFRDVQDAYEFLLKNHPVRMSV